ncbi:MAG: hypothetical protein K5657_10265 [Desulfovibrio sp.]|nr:hypothetical protein [Desulfovibrio sp.]
MAGHDRRIDVANVRITVRQSRCLRAEIPLLWGGQRERGMRGGLPNCEGRRGNELSGMRTLASRSLGDYISPMIQAFGLETPNSFFAREARRA